MKYTFPIINKFKDVEVYLNDYFKVSRQNGVLYINYKFLSPDVFPEVKPKDYRAACFREFRGIAFNESTGEILSRPFHKFFNKGERPEEELGYNPTVVQEKLDGSLVRPILMPSGALRWATKAGLTDVSLKAEKFLTHNSQVGYETVAANLCSRGYTPIFEYCSPDNKIVLDYKEPSLTLLAVRNTVSGEYLPLDHENLEPILKGIPTVKKVTNSNVKDDTDKEGLVFVYSSGHRLKVKTDWYVKRHKAKTLIENEKRIISILLEDNLDDMLSSFDLETKKLLLDYAGEFWQQVYTNADELSVLFDALIAEFKTKKDFALSKIELPPWQRGGIFYLWDDKGAADEYIKQVIGKNISSEVAYQRIKETMELPSIRSSIG